MHRCSGRTGRHHPRHRRKHPPLLRRPHDRSPHQPAGRGCAPKREAAHSVGVWRHRVGGRQELRQVHRHRHSDPSAGRPDQSRHGWYDKNFFLNNNHTKIS